MEEQAQKRPSFLTVLCILTFIGSGLGFLTFLFFTIGVGALGSLATYMGASGTSILGAGVVTTVVPMLLYAASIIGAAMMFKLKKIGFYLYAIAQVILLILMFSWVGLIFTAAFIVMYAVNLKAMN